MGHWGLYIFTAERLVAQKVVSSAEPKDLFGHMMDVYSILFGWVKDKKNTRNYI